MKFTRKGDGAEIVLAGEWSVSLETTDAWEDVTKQCSHMAGFGLIHDERELNPVKYRVRKLRLFDHGQGREGMAFDPVVQYAFIVERKKP